MSTVTRDIFIIILLLAANAVIVLVTLLVSFFRARENRIKLRFYALFYIACPVVGPLCLAVYGILCAIFHLRDDDYSAMINTAGRTDFLLEPDENVEMNYIPIQDALEMSDVGSMRRLLMDLLKSRSVLDSPRIVQAISSEDAETAHYAATALTSFLSDFRAAAQVKVSKMHEPTAAAEDFADTISYIYPVLKAGIMGELEYASYLQVYMEAMEQLYQKDRWQLEPAAYLSITDMMISGGNYAEARKWTMRARENRPDELETYKCELHLYYAVKSGEEFFDVLDRIKRSAVPIDKEILDRIRLLNGGD